MTALFFLLPPLAFAQYNNMHNTISCENSDYPGIIWQENEDSNAFDLNKLQSLKKFLSDSSNTTGMMVIHKGKVLLAFGNITESTAIASVRKSILSLLYGPFITNGVIQLSTTLEQLKINDLGGLLPIEKKATIKELLTARSGIYHPASNGGDALDMAPPRGTMKPGEFWLYNNWDFNTAGYILEKQTGKSIYQLTDLLLAKPLQMEDWQMYQQKKEGDTSKSKYLAYSMSLSTRDMARIGYLMLRNGKWKKQQIVSENWIKTITSVVTTNKEAQANQLAYLDFAYGYLWWIWDNPCNKAYTGAYTASGVRGQFITVLPELDLVIAHKTNLNYREEVTTEQYLNILNKLIVAKR